MAGDRAPAQHSVSFASLLGLLFIGLKLGGVIDWPWWLVLAPFWGPLLILAVSFAAGLAFLLWREGRK